MSDQWIVLISEDPAHVPAPDRLVRAKDQFARIAPSADRIEVRIHDDIEFVDCGGNFESIACPSCEADLSMEWWTDRLDEDRQDNGYRLEAYRLPCCGARRTLHQLKYHWPQGFARISIEAMNPGIGNLEERYQSDFEEILGTNLRIIYRHL